MAFMSSITTLVLSTLGQAMTHLNLRPPVFHAGGMPLGKMHSLRQSGYTSRVTVVGVIVPAAAAGIRTAAVSQ